MTTKINLDSSKQVSVETNIQDVKSGGVTLRAKEEFVQQAVDCENEMVGLCHNIDHLLSSEESHTLLFVSSRRGEGVTSIINNFAKVSVKLFNKRVFLFEHDTDHFSQGITPKEQNENINLFLERNEKPQHDFWLSGGGNLFYRCPISFFSKSYTSLLSQSVKLDFMSKMKSKFDLILFDCLPALESNDYLSVARHVDGVILVVEADSTRHSVIQKIREDIELVGGNVLGLILNKQKHYIPEFLYRHL